LQKAVTLTLISQGWSLSSHLVSFQSALNGVCGGVCLVIWSIEPHVSHLTSGGICLCYWIPNSLVYHICLQNYNTSILVKERFVKRWNARMWKPFFVNFVHFLVYNKNLLQLWFFFSLAGNNLFVQEQSDCKVAGLTNSLH